MNNDAFSSLVKKHNEGKSTKEIAREAVEKEFQEKKKNPRNNNKRRNNSNKHGDGYSSEEGEENEINRRWKKSNNNDDETNADEPKWKQLRRLKKRMKKEEDGIHEYRDRAKERREGKQNTDYDDEISKQQLLKENPRHGIAATTDEMTKYLGGEEKFTHLVKGLDYALARKVRREEMADNSLALKNRKNNHKLFNNQNQIISDDTAMKYNTQNIGTNDAMNSDDIHKLLQRISQKNLIQPNNNPDHQQLITGLLSFLQHKIGATKSSYNSNNSNTKEASIAGQTIQRSTLTFSLEAHPGDTKNSWQLPKESTLSCSQFEQYQKNKSKKRKPLHSQFIQRIDKAFKDKQAADKKINYIASNCKDKDKNMKNYLDSNVKDDTTDDHISNGNKDYKKGQKLTSGNVVVDDDFDIFADVGEYNPPSISKEVNSHPKSEKIKGSTIFSGLEKNDETLNIRKNETKFLKDNQQKVSQKVSQNIESSFKIRKSSKDKIIDRDLFGMCQDQQTNSSTRKNSSSSQSNRGVSMNNYSGEGYGEEMDTDFDGRFAPEDDEPCHSKKKDKNNFD